MDGVLEGALALCVCKLACSLLVLPSLAASHSPVGFCSCCLLVFTDFLLTVFLSTSWLFEPWLSAPSPLADVVALRFLLFLSHTYRAVLLLTTPLVAAETLIRRLRSHAVSDGQRCHAGEGDAEDSEGDRRLSHAVGYVCCLSVWVTVALNLRWRWKLEEAWAAACLHTAGSLLTCLPKLLSPAPSVGSPCWGLAFLLLLLLLLLLFLSFLLLVTNALQRKQTRPSLAPASPVSPGTSEPARRVDPEKTESGCGAANRARSWNGVQMSARHHGDLVLISPTCLSVKRGRREHKRTMRGLPATRLAQQHVSRCGWRPRGFPCSGLSVMTGLLAALAVFVLPLYLSVNILLIRTVETLLQLAIKPLVSPPAPSHEQTLV